MDSGKKRILVTSALPYANGDIHLGHLLEAVQTDIFVRFQKLLGHEVIYVCADDTHGTPIELSALKQKITPEELIAKAYTEHTKDYKGFNIGFDIFYSTNSPENKFYAEYIYKTLQENGLISEKEVSQYYCEHDKRFLPDRLIIGTCPKCKAEKQYGDVCEVCGATYDPSELIEPKCYLCTHPPVFKKSKNLYVELPQKEEYLKNYLSQPGVLQDEMKNFVMSWIDDGLKPWCISRDGPYFGFKIPGTENKFFYVWLDAPIGYLSSTEKWCKDHNRSIKEFWSADSDTQIVHFIGKDIVYFHALFWPVMLDSAKFKTPSRIFVHGFLNINGEKMSKSRGTFILARDFREKVKHPQAPEFLRFYYASKLNSGAADLDLIRDEFLLKINTILVNNLGNLHNRTLVFCERYFENSIPDAPWDEEIARQVETASSQIEEWYDKGEYRAVVEKIQALGSIGNKYYQDQKPWELVKSNKEAAAKVMVTCANLLKSIAIFLHPITPSISTKALDQLGCSPDWSELKFSLRNRKLSKVEKLIQPIENAELDELFSTNKNEKSEKVENIDYIEFDEFKNVDLRTGIIKSARKIEKSSKLLCLQVEVGDSTRQIVAGIAQSYTPEQLLGKTVVIVANLKPAILFGEKSEGMILAVQSKSGQLIVLQPEKEVESGAKVS